LPNKLYRHWKTTLVDEWNCYRWKMNGTKRDKDHFTLLNTKDGVDYCPIVAIDFRSQSSKLVINFSIVLRFLLKFKTFKTLTLLLLDYLFTSSRTLLPAAMIRRRLHIQNMVWFRELRWWMNTNEVNEISWN